jgi:hypothetical protein
MRTIPGRRVAIVSCLLAVLVVASSALFFGRLREYWYLLQLRSGNEEVRTRAAASLAEMKSLRAVSILVEEIKRRKSEQVEIGLRPDPRLDYVFSNPPRRRFKYGADGGRGCVLLSSIAHALYSVGKEAAPIVQKHLEGHTYFNEDIQRYLDVLEAVVWAWKNPEIPVRRRGADSPGS